MSRKPVFDDDMESGHYSALGGEFRFSREPYAHVRNRCRRKRLFKRGAAMMRNNDGGWNVWVTHRLRAKVRAKR